MVDDRVSCHSRLKHAIEDVPSQITIFRLNSISGLRIFSATARVCLSHLTIAQAQSARAGLQEISIRSHLVQSQALRRTEGSFVTTKYRKTLRTCPSPRICRMHKVLPDLACRRLSPFCIFSDWGMSELFCNTCKRISCRVAAWV